MARLRRNSVIISLVEAPHLITAIYKQINKDDVCTLCKKPARFIRIELAGEKITRLNKLCRRCEAVIAAREVRQWQRVRN